MPSILSLSKARVGSISVEIRETDAAFRFHFDHPVMRDNEVTLNRVVGLRIGDELLKIREALLAAKALFVACDSIHPSDNADVNAKKMTLIRLLNDLEIH
jgi:hypothetical protein